MEGHALGFEARLGMAFGLSEGLCAVERELLEKALSRFKTTRELARHLGISQPTVVRKLKKYELSPRPMHD